MKFKIFKYDNVTSTNDMAIDLIKKEKKETGYVYAVTQTKGRGTHGKGWVSDKGNLFGSIFFPLKNNFPPFNEFSTINPLILSEVIQHFCDKKNINLKFPNDIFVNKKKICGILQELIVSNSRKFLIIGIGVNSKISPKNKSFKSISLSACSNHIIKNDEILIRIKLAYEKIISNLKKHKK